MIELADLNYFRKITDKKRDFPLLILRSTDRVVTYAHTGTGSQNSNLFKDFVNYPDHSLESTWYASLPNNEKIAFDNWLELLVDEVYVELMVPEDFVKMAPSFTLTWSNGQNYQVRFEAVRTEHIYGYVMVWFEPHGESSQQKLASEIIELLSQVRNLPKENISNLQEYLPEVKGNFVLSNFTDEVLKQDLIGEILRSLHAAKGTLYFLGLTVLGDAFHETESVFSELRKSWTYQDGLQPIKDALNHVHLLITLAEGIITKVLTGQGQASENLTVANRDYDELINEFNPLISAAREDVGLRNWREALEKIYFRILRIDSTSLNPLIERLLNSTGQLSKELNKPAQFSAQMSGFNVYVPHRLLDSLWNALFQILKNSLDHGIENASVRQTINKPAQANIQFMVEHNEKNILTLKLRDDGKGIDPQLILKTALVKKMITAKEAKTLEASNRPELIFGLIFLPGFSTQKNITKISGRGVGTDVVQKEIESYGGNITVSSEVNQFTEFAIYLPIEKNRILIEAV